MIESDLRRYQELLIKAQADLENSTETQKFLQQRAQDLRDPYESRKFYRWWHEWLKPGHEATRQLVYQIETFIANTEEDK